METLPIELLRAMLRQANKYYRRSTEKAAAKLRVRDFTSSVSMLHFAHKNGCPWDEQTCAYAAKSGHLEVLRYAHENGCPWDEQTCCYAITCGNVDALQYAHENGCPWDEQACAYAAHIGNVDVLRYAH